MKPALIPALLCLALAACAPATVQQLRKEASGVHRFEIARNYQPVYRTILEQARKCFQAGMITAQMMVQGDLYHDIRSGTVSVALHGGIGVNTFLAIDIRAIDDKRTAVEVYHALITGADKARSIEEWVRDNSTECGPKAARGRQNETTAPPAVPPR